MGSGLEISVLGEIIFFEGLTEQVLLGEADILERFKALLAGR